MGNRFFSIITVVLILLFVVSIKVIFAKETSAVSPTPTPEMVITKEATDVTSNSATLNGRVPLGTPAAYMYFEYGTTSGTYTTSIDAGRDDLSNSVYARISGLSPATIYYYRIVVVQKGTPPPNPAEYTYGEEKFFKTLSETATPTYECEAERILVSPSKLRLKRGQSSDVTVILEGNTNSLSNIK